MPATVTGRPARKRGGAADGRLDALLERGADDHVLDLGGVDPGALDGSLDRMGGERGRGRGVERALIGLADGGAGGGDDDGVANGHIMLLEAGK